MSQRRPPWAGRRLGGRRARPRAAPAGAPLTRRAAPAVASPCPPMRLAFCRCPCARVLAPDSCLCRRPRSCLMPRPPARARPLAGAPRRRGVAYLLFSRSSSLARAPRRPPACSRAGLQTRPAYRAAVRIAARARAQAAPTPPPCPILPFQVARARVSLGERGTSELSCADTNTTPLLPAHCQPRARALQPPTPSLPLLPRLCMPVAPLPVLPDERTLNGTLPACPLVPR